MTRRIVGSSTKYGIIVAVILLLIGAFFSFRACNDSSNDSNDSELYLYDDSCVCVDSAVVDYDSEVIEFIESMYNDTKYEDYAFLEEYCTKRLLKKLRREYYNDYCGDGYAVWLFRSGADDGSSDEHSIISVDPEEDGWYTYSYYDMGLKGVNRIKIIHDGGSILIDDIEVIGSEDPTYTPGDSLESDELAVDLGLSVKWAKMNIGATCPEEYGEYYAWGETKPKSTYDWNTYKWCNSSRILLTKYCISSRDGEVDDKTSLDPEDDVAHVSWGNGWRVPTRAEYDELRNNCTWTLTTQNGLKGYKVTSATNGNSIFLPAAGSRDEGGLSRAGSDGVYWSSMLQTSDSYSAEGFSFDLDINKVYKSSPVTRYIGLPVRAVCP